MIVVFMFLGLLSSFFIGKLNLIIYIKRSLKEAVIFSFILLAVNLIWSIEMMIVWGFLFIETIIYYFLGVIVGGVVIDVLRRIFKFLLKTRSSA